jgi:tRNA A37 threonylcarbamoyladenosine modification protein TsaB
MTSLESSSQDGNSSKLSIIVDTSQKGGRLLVIDQNYEIVFSAHWNHPARHTEQLLLEFQKCKSLIQNSHPEKIYFISGPGSFTGLRVGATFIKSLGLVFKTTPIYCINSFKITASHVINKLKLKKTFTVCISSIGDMAFRSDYEFANKVFQKETLHLSGAQDYSPVANKVFSPNHELSTKFSDITHIEVDDEDYLSAVRELDQDNALLKVYTHLDLYPLYLRKSEAEEKYRYDKAKL